MTDEQLHLHRLALSGASAVVAEVTDADLGRPTPCAGWDLSDLLAHLVGQNLGFAACARDGDAPPSAYAPVPFTHEAWLASADELVEAFAGLDLARTVVEVELAPVPLPARVVVGAQLLDSAVHAWDVARALGRDHVPEDAVVAAVLEVALPIPDDERRERPGSAFARAVPDEAEADGEGATDWRRVLRLLGRDPGWGPPGGAPIVNA